MDINYYKKYEPIFNAYYLEKLLGEGSFGKVFLVRRESFGKTYNAALKAITIPHSENDLKHKLSYMTEANAKSYYEKTVNGIVDEFHYMSKLKGHSHIISYEDHDVKLHESGIGWDILIRMELLTPLSQHTDLQNISREDVIRLGIDISKALEKCQAENIIHRDIKPENMFVSADGNYKLGDFGVARTIELTTDNFTRIGTPSYMAPEIHIGDQYASSIDIYSLGLVLYRLLNKNRMPFLPPYPEAIEPGDEDTAIADRINGRELIPPVNADKKLADIVLKACAHKPQDRYQRPEMLREDLEAIQRMSKPAQNAPTVEAHIKEDKEKAPLSKLSPTPIKSNKYKHIYNTTESGSHGIPNGTATIFSHENQKDKSQKREEHTKIAAQANSKPPKLGYMQCPYCKSEIRKGSLSCISCRRQLR